MDPTYWTGKPPTLCDGCEKMFFKCFAHGKTRKGIEGNFCLYCLRTACSDHDWQIFRKQPDGHWRKIEEAA